MTSAADDIAARLLIVSLPRMGPVRARWLLGDGEAGAVIDELRSGRLPGDRGPAPPGVTLELIRTWSSKAREQDLPATLETHRSLGIRLMSPLDARWPFTDDPDPPVLLFYAGDLSLARGGPAVAVVGTRRCTSVGRSVAYELGSGLADAGVTVVSGLALGIDGSGHRGALDHGRAAVGVVGSGLDVVYPGANRSLWEEVADRGLLLGEAPAGCKPARWRFPARNRLIAALSDGVVIVESHGRGGALLTADEAALRGVPVMAVPGSVLSAASDGTNALLVDGAVPVRNSTDVLDHLGFPPPTAASGAAPDPGGSGPGPGVATGPAETIMTEVRAGAAHIDRLVEATDLAVADLLPVVQALVTEGRLLLDGSTVSLAPILDSHRHIPN